MEDSTPVRCYCQGPWRTAVQRAVRQRARRWPSASGTGAACVEICDRLRQSSRIWSVSLHGRQEPRAKPTQPTRFTRRCATRDAFSLPRCLNQYQPDLDHWTIQLFTILHISDLHRTPDDPVSNAQLVSSLVSDRERYTIETPRISPPDAIVVSGDVIRGVPLGGAAGDLERQYDDALEFLGELTNRLLDGDRSRVVVVPGNHDVDWNAARSAMDVIEEADWPTKLSTVLRSPQSPYRWVLDEHRLYKIQDPSLYESRFDHFNMFFERFYEDVQLPASSPEQPYMRLFELFDGRIVVAGFNSCFGNDCYAQRGVIPCDTIARADLDIRDTGNPYELRIAVWHHNTDGPPHSDDYMDVDLVRQMIGVGFQLGLHGHQHRFDVVPHEIHLPGPETMALVSAGSLCAGQRELPRGANRQYNVVEIADDLTSAVVHVREVVSSMNFAARRLAQLGGESFVKLAWRPALNAAGVAPDYERLRRSQDILAAEANLKSGHFKEVTSSLGPEASDLDLYGRLLLLQATLALSEPKGTIKYATPPQSIDELTILVRAHVQLRRFEEASKALSQYAATVDLPTPNVASLEQWIRGQEALSA